MGADGKESHSRIDGYVDEKLFSMMPRSEIQISFTRLCAVSRDVVYLGTMPEDQELGTPFTAICQYYHGEWSYETFDFPLASLCLYRAPDSPHRVLYILSETGVAVNFHTKEREVLLPATSPIRRSHRLGLMRKIRQIGDHLFACGDGGQVYRRATDGTWSILDEAFLDGPDMMFDPRSPLAQLQSSMRDKANRTPENFALFKKMTLEAMSNVLWDLSGISDESVYLVSEKKTLFHYNGERINAATSQADEGILAVHAVDAETVYACGRDGNFLVGNSKSGFRKLDVRGTPVFNGMAMFQGKLYLSSIGRPRGLFVYDGSRLERVHSDLTPDIDDVSAVSAIGDEVLWVMGVKDLLRFDGETWERIPFPPNEQGQR